MRGTSHLNAEQSMGHTMILPEMEALPDSMALPLDNPFAIESRAIAVRAPMIPNPPILDQSDTTALRAESFAQAMRMQRVGVPPVVTRNAYSLIRWQSVREPKESDASQGNRGTCWSFAAAAALEAAYLRAFNINIDVSEAYIFHVGKAFEIRGDFRAGTYPLENNSSLGGFQGNSAVARNLFYVGTPDERLAPYYATQAELEALLPPLGYANMSALVTQEDWDAFEYSESLIPLISRVNCRYRAIDWKSLSSPPTIAEIEATLRADCEVIVDVGNAGGGHVMLIIGYDADRRVFQTKNSWGGNDIGEIKYENDPTWTIQAAHYIRGVVDPRYVQNEQCWLGNWWFHQDGQTGRLLIRRSLDFRNLGTPTKLGNLYIGNRRFDVNGSMQDNGMVLDMYVAGSEEPTVPGTSTGRHYQVRLSHADIFTAQGRELGVNLLTRGHSGVTLTRFATRYAGIWEQGDTAPWQARHGLTADEYQATFDELTQTGFRPVQVSGYTEGNSARFAAIFSQSPSGAWEARHGLTSEEFQARFDVLAREGYRLRDISGYTIDGVQRFTGIWEQADGPAWQARHGQTSEEFQATFDQLTGAGYRLMRVAGYRVNVGVRFVSIYERREGPPWQARHNLTSAQYQQTFDALVAQGFRLTSVSGYSNGGQTLYAGVWEQHDGTAWQGRHGIDAPAYQRSFDELAQLGFHPVHVVGYGVGFA